MYIRLSFANEDFCSKLSEPQRRFALRIQHFSENSYSMPKYAEFLMTQHLFSSIEEGADDGALQAIRQKGQKDKSCNLMNFIDKFRVAFSMDAGNFFCHLLRLHRFAHKVFYKKEEVL